MKYVFYCQGHENILAIHPKTIEFTKDSDVSVRGDCIVGVRSAFDSSEIRKLRGKVTVTVEVGGLEDTFKAVINPDFDDDHEIVFRKSMYKSRRTLGHKLSKGSHRLDRDIIRLMQNPDTVMKVTIEEMNPVTNVPSGRMREVRSETKLTQGRSGTTTAW